MAVFQYSVLAWYSPWSYLLILQSVFNFIIHICPIFCVVDSPMASISEATCHDGKEGHDSVSRGAFDTTGQTRPSDMEHQTSTNIAASSSVPLNHPSTSPSSVKMNSSQISQSSAAGSRSLSHSLLSASPDPSVSSRKSTFADSGTTSAVGRASISMPPPSTKPSNHKPPILRQTTATLASGDALVPYSGQEKAAESNMFADPASVEDLDKTKNLGSPRGKVSSDSGTRSSLSDSTRPANLATVNTESDGHRLSFSSLYSLGSVVYSAAAGGSSAPSGPSASSSVAGSVKSGALDQPTTATLPASSPLSTAKIDLLSATTATDTISVVANSRSPHAGLRITPFLFKAIFWLISSSSSIQQSSIGFVHGCG